MATGPAWLVLALKLDGHDSEYIKQKLTGASTVGTQLADGRFTKKALRGVENILSGAAGGAYGANVWATVLDNAGTLATGNIACTQANASGNYVRFTYGALTITLTEGTDFARGASNTTCAANLAAAINAHAVLGSIYTALGAVGDCGLTAKLPTALIQDIAISTDDATAFGLTQLTGATEGAAKVFLQQIWTNRTR